MLSRQEQLQRTVVKDELFTCMHEDVDQNTQEDSVQNNVATHSMLLAKELRTYKDTCENSELQPKGK